MRYVILDTETTGFEPELGHKLVEIGAVEMIDRQLTGRHFHHYLNPQRDSDEGALAVHGLTTEFLRDKPLFKTIADDLLEFIDGATVLIHNAAFDTKFINAELAAIQRAPMETICAVEDTLHMARQMFPGKRNNLDALCERLGVSNADVVRKLALAICDLGLNRGHLRLGDVDAAPSGLRSPMTTRSKLRSSSVWGRSCSTSGASRYAFMPRKCAPMTSVIS